MKEQGEHPVVNKGIEFVIFNDGAIGSSLLNKVNVGIECVDRVKPRSDRVNQ